MNKINVRLAVSFAYAGKFNSKDHFAKNTRTTLTTIASKWTDHYQIWNAFFSVCYKNDESCEEEMNRKMNGLNAIFQL